MFGASSAWDGIGSSVVGGVIAAAFVVIGVWFAQWLRDNRTAGKDRRDAAAQLMVEVSNLRDNACSAKADRVKGIYPMWMLRNALFVTHVVLQKYPSYRVVREFYRTVYHWRWWSRKQAEVQSDMSLEERLPVVVNYRAELRAYGNHVIEMLQNALEDQSLRFDQPVLPELPGLAAGPDDIDGERAPSHRRPSSSNSSH
jgi:hypothetical protein